MINELTDEQRDQIAVYRDKWLEIGKNCKDIPYKEVNARIDELYRATNREEPTVIYVESTLAMIKVYNILDADESKIESISKKPKTADLRFDGKMEMPRIWYGQHNANWVAYYQYFNDVFNFQPENKELWEALLKVSHLHWFIPCVGVCIVSKKPKYIKMEDDRLHCDNGPAVEYKDGFCVFSLHGVRVPKWLAVTDWKDIDCKEFHKIDNVEVKREFLRKVGAERLLQKLGGKTVDEKTKEARDGTKYDYEVVLLDLGGETGKWPYLKFNSASINVTEMQPLPEDCRTVDAALEFRNGDPGMPEWLV